MFKIKTGRTEAERKLREIKHDQFLNSIGTKWTVDAERKIRPQSICWLFVWAANADPKWQLWAEKLRQIFDEIMPFNYDQFAKQVGKKQAEILRDRKSDSKVFEALTALLGSETREPPVIAELASIAAKLEEEGAFNVFALKDERERRLRAVVMRQGQPDFRNKLISAYSGRCAITGCDAVFALEAAHIVAYTGPESNHVQNGLLLRADIHTLFDLDLIGIDPATLNIAIAPAISDTVYSELRDKPLRMPTELFASPSRDSLAVRWLQSCGEKDGAK